MNVPADLRFLKSHEWLRADGTVGISDHAQQELTDIVYVELPEVGKSIEAGSAICVVESVKAASDIYSPAGGKVIAVNDALSSQPELINTDPYGQGWIFRLEVAGGSDALLSAEQYTEQIGGA